MENKTNSNGVRDKKFTKAIGCLMACVAIYMLLGTWQLNVTSKLQDSIASAGVIAGMQLKSITPLSVGVGPFVIASIVMSVLTGGASKIMTAMKKSDNKKYHKILKGFEFVIASLYLLSQVIVLIGPEEIGSFAFFAIIIGSYSTIILGYGLSKVGFKNGRFTLIAVNSITMIIQLPFLIAGEGEIGGALQFALITLVGYLYWLYVMTRKCGYTFEVTRDGYRQDISVDFEKIPDLLMPLVLISLSSTFIPSAFQDIYMAVGLALGGIYGVYRNLGFKMVEDSCQKNEFELSHRAVALTRWRKMQRKMLWFYLGILSLSLIFIDGYFYSNREFFQSTLSLIFTVSLSLSLYKDLKHLMDN